VLHSSEAKLGHARQARWLVLALTFAAVGLAACGDGGATTTSDAGARGEQIVIKTHAVIHIPQGGPRPGESIGGGQVLAGSSIGNAPFCPGGTFSDMHQDDPAIGLVDRTFTCPDGSLRIGFTPGVPQGRTQAGPWRVVSGTGAFDGLQGDGQMKMRYEPGTRATKGHETFAGTVTP
jgi:hypothetical protein